MRSRLLLVALFGVLSNACTREAQGTPRVPPRETPREARAERARTCSVPGLDGARPVERVALPPGCTFTNVGSASAPAVLTTSQDVAGAISCPDGATATIDLSTHDLYVVEYTVSPASVGTEALDDGTTLTFLTRFRSPCPGDSMPMPMNATLAFVMPKQATRTFREATCSLPEDCR